MSVPAEQLQQEPVVPAVPDVAAAPATPPVTGEQPPPPAPPAEPVEEERVPISRLRGETKLKWEERRRAEAAEADNKRLKEEMERLKAAPPAQAPVAAVLPAAGAPPVTTAPAAQTPEEIDRQVDQRAAQRREAERFNEACQRTYERGVGDKDTPDFKAAVDAFNVFGGLGAHPALVTTTVSDPNGHKVLHHLGNNLDEAERILRLPPLQLAAEIGRLSKQLSAPAPLSSAPPPITPVRGGGGGETIVGPDANGDFPGANEAERQANYRRWRKRQFQQ
jgi:hypothetical protein